MSLSGVNDRTRVRIVGRLKGGRLQDDRIAVIFMTGAMSTVSVPTPTLRRIERDHIDVLDSAGSLVESGDFDTVLAQQPIVSMADARCCRDKLYASMQIAETMHAGTPY